MELDDIRKLIDIMKDTDVTDLELEKAGTRIRLRREKQIAAGSASPSIKAVVEEAVKAEPVHDESTQRLVTVTAPLVGTFYKSSSPDSPPFAEVGQRVSKGQVLCIVEAMKLMNEIESEIDGIVVKVLVENAQPVEYGEPLFLIDPV